MNFELSPDQKLFTETAGSFARKESPVTRLRALREDSLGWSKRTWKQLGELGWLGLVLPEAVGGLALSFVDLALVLEQLGTTLVPEPIVPAVVLAGGAIAALGTDAQKERWLAPLAAGDTSLALAYAEREGRYDLARVSTRAERAGAGFRLSGEKVFVLNGHGADHLVVSARTAGAPAERGGLGLFVVDPSAKGLEIRPVRTMDGQRAALVRLDGVEAASDAVLGDPGGAFETLDLVVDRAAAAACAEGAGILQAVLAMTRDYLCTRDQFGVKIGSFQALAHRAVDMFVETELARSTAILAAIRADESDAELRREAVSAAKVQLATSGRFVTQQSIQLHGGIGVTDEHDVGLYFKRMSVLNSLFGDDEHHVRRFASLASFTAGI